MPTEFRNDRTKFGGTIQFGHHVNHDLERIYTSAEFFYPTGDGYTQRSLGFRFFRQEFHTSLMHGFRVSPGPDQMNSIGSPFFFSIIHAARDSFLSSILCHPVSTINYTLRRSHPRTGLTFKNPAFRRRWAKQTTARLRQEKRRYHDPACHD